MKHWISLAAAFTPGESGKAASGCRATENARLKVQIRRIHGPRHTRFYGSPWMTAELNSKGLSCSVNRVARLMRSEGIRARPQKPFRPKTTQPDHAATPSPNLLAKADSPQRPGEQVVSDTTYVPTREGWMYLAVVIDLFSRTGPSESHLPFRSWLPVHQPGPPPNDHSTSVATEHERQRILL